MRGRLCQLTALLALASCGDTAGEIFTTVGPDAAGGGDGGGDVCAVDGPCPLPGPGGISVCGRVLDLATSEVIVDASERGIDVAIVDPIDLPLQAVLTEVVPDQCGWFSAEVDDAPVLGLIGVVADDISGTDYQPAGSVLSVSPGQVVRSNIYVVRVETLASWAVDAGLPGGFGGSALVAVFIEPGAAVTGPLRGTPVAGVEATVGGAPMPASDYYFNDSDALGREILAPGSTSTGLNGSVLILDPAAGAAVGGQRTGCDFAQATAVGVDGIVQVQEIYGDCL